MLTPVRRRLAVVAAVLLVPSLGACQYQTDKVYQPGVGVNNRDGTVDVLGAVVVSSTEGKGTFVASLANQDLEQTETLTGITGEDVEVTANAFEARALQHEIDHCDGFLFLDKVAGAHAIYQRKTYL